MATTTSADAALIFQQAIDAVEGAPELINTAVIQAQAAAGQNFYNLTVDEMATPSATVFNSLGLAVASLPHNADGVITLNHDVSFGPINFKGFRGVIKASSPDTVTLKSAFYAGDNGTLSPGYIADFRGNMINLILETLSYDVFDDVNYSVHHAFFRHSYPTRVHLTSCKVKLGDQRLIATSGLDVEFSTNAYGAGVEFELLDLVTVNRAHALLSLQNYTTATYGMYNYTMPDGISAESLVLGARCVTSNFIPLNIKTNLVNWG